MPEKANLELTKKEVLTILGALDELEEVKSATKGPTLPPIVDVYRKLEKSLGDKS